MPKEGIQIYLITLGRRTLHEDSAIFNELLYAVSIFGGKMTFCDSRVVDDFACACKALSVVAKHHLSAPSGL
jgi:hypothetical protein